MSDDRELLRQYAEEGSAEAFAEFVRRNAGLVYGAALRRVGDAHRAEDVVQTVFIAVARKARTLRQHPALLSWLHTSARFASLKEIRREQRQRWRERETMHLTNDRSPDWETLRPLIDEVLDALGERDREIILLRFFRALPFAEVANLLRISEGAARTRADRALDRMNRLFRARGITSTAAVLGTTLAAEAAALAPAALAARVTAVALAGAPAAPTAGALASLFVMTKSHVILGTLLFAGLVTAVVEYRTQLSLREELGRRGPLFVPATLQHENDSLRAAIAGAAQADPAVEELARVRTRLAVLKARPDGVTDAALHAPRNLGRATPADAVETFCWAVDRRDLDLVASFVRFSDNTPEAREAFLANFSEALRTRYRTPERIAAAAMFGATIVANRTSADDLSTLQVVSVRETHGAGEVQIALWMRSVSGLEVGGNDSYTLGVDGWGMKPMSLQNPKLIEAIQQRLDPVTGDYRGPTRTRSPRT